MEERTELTQSARDIGIVTAEIKDLKQRAQSMALWFVVEIGKRLIEAKEVLPHGSWGNWLKNEVEFSQSTANNFMRLYEEYGDRQVSLFGALSNSQSIANLDYTKALKLIAVPEDERERFAETAKDMSVKQLEAAIRERNEAAQRAEDEKRRAEAAEEKLAELQNAEDAVHVAENDAKMMRIKAEETEKELENVRTELKKLQEDSRVSADKISELKKQAKKDAEHKLLKELEKMRASVESAERAAEDAKAAEARTHAELTALQNKIKTSDADVAAFKTLFDTLQSTLAKSKSIIEKVRRDNAETAEKLSNALKALGDEFAKG